MSWMAVFIAPWACSALLAQTIALSRDGLTSYDSVNNITWLADANLPAANRFGLPLCQPAAPKGQICVSPGGSMNYPSAQAWVAALNAADYLGHNNWQLPTTPMDDKNCGRTGPTGNKFGFGCIQGALASLYYALGFNSPNTAVPIPPNTAGPFSNLQPYLYWSASDGSSPAAGHATFSFATGWQGANTLPNFLYLLPMIRGRLPGLPAPSGNGLQISADKQTVYDPQTGITWLANANLAAGNTFGLPRCVDSLTPAVCIASDGAMTWSAALQFLANMNSAAWLGQTKWEAPTIDQGCPGFNCDGDMNPMGNLFYDQLGLTKGMPATPTSEISAGPFRNLQPYLYWSCIASTIQRACEIAGPADNFEESYSFGAGFQGTDVLDNYLYVTAYFVGSRTSTAGPVISYVANAEGENPAISPDTWIEIKGANLAPAGDSRIWQSSDFIGNTMPTQLDKVGVTVNGRNAYVYYVSPSQINVLTPPDAMSGTVPIVVTVNGVASATFSAQAQALSPSFFVFDGAHVAAVHANGGLIGPPRLYPGSTTPASPGETIALYANGFGPVSVPVISGSITQSGTLSPLPVIKIGGATAAIQFAGLVSPGEYQINVVVPPNLSDGDQPVTATFQGASTQSGALLTVQH